jgi:hypothetical protein
MAFSRFPRAVFLWMLAATLLVLPSSALGQSANDGVKLVGLMQACKYDYHTTRSPVTWFIRFNGDHMKEIPVILSYGSDPVELVVFVTVVKKQRMPVNTDFMRTLLQQNHLFDRVKIAFDADGDLEVRTDSPFRLTDAQDLRDIVNQVKNTANEVYGVIEPNLLP